MPVTDLVNTSGAKQFVYPVPVALLSEDSGAPTPADASDTIIPIRVVRSAGGRMDFADLEIPITENLVNREQPADFARIIDIRLSMAGDTYPTPSGPSQHLGDYVKETEEVSSTGEKLTGQSQVKSYHYGKTLRGMLVYNKLKDANEWIDGEILFNPMVDGKVLKNQSSKQRGGGLNSYLWAHPETSQTSRSTTWQTQSLSDWTLLNAVQTLCEACNDGETFIRNPETAELAVLSGAPVMHDIRLKAGEYLPHYLDRILPPLGFNWFLKYTADPAASTKTKPKIHFFKRFEGTSKKIFFQMPGSTPLDLALSNVNQYSVTRSIADSINEVEIFGDYVRREITLKLWPMWAATDDGTSRTALDKTASGSGYFSDKQLVWRAWGANLDGSLTGLRSDALAAGNPPDLTTVFPVWIPHRRTIEEPISMYGQDTRIPYYLEYSVNAGTDWALCPDEWGAKLAPDDIVVIFDADMPPEELMTAGTSARLRITGTVAGDSRLRGFAEKQTYSVNGRNVRMTLTLEDKFQDRQVQTTGTWASTIPSSATDERDDTDEIQTHAEEIRDRNNGAELDCEVSLPGFHVGFYEIGDLITEIDGREVSLNAASPTDPTPRYPQITEIRLEVTDKGPRTVLILDRGD
jgi:hypothetical protein